MAARIEAPRMISPSFFGGPMQMRTACSTAWPLLAKLAEGDDLVYLRTRNLLATMAGGVVVVVLLRRLFMMEDSAAASRMGLATSSPIREAARSIPGKADR